MASLSLPLLVSGGQTYPSPFADESVILDYFRSNSAPALITALLQFAASIPLAIFAAAASVRLQTLGIRAPGAAIALTGGILASAAMSFSAMLTWTLSRPELVEHAEIVRLLHDLAFIAGGPGVVVPSGLLAAGIAVPGLLAGLLPRWLSWAGLIVAAVAMLSTLSFIVPLLSVLLPLARFPFLAFLIVVAFRLPKNRAPANRTTVSGRVS
ncbi:hypothetical protein [Paramicrobacterium chengjingii]|uniref:DUF4386 domain-containing protein n=1 Tax=Paramicrobacterium chengjingii TaxID=2769067 RepID=A0ABX6YIY0_9MICO|nr:hypothetical protein [Microbacterium chengjingii]QPZ38733.1 hypothetical protein HCR76_01080 [Microbacterium chengjingii]